MPGQTKPLAAAIEGGFTIDDFAYDKAAGTLTCPNGLSRKITAKGRVTFGAACRGCPLRGRCTTASNGRKIELHPDDELMRATAPQPENTCIRGKSAGKGDHCLLDGRQFTGELIAT